MKPILRRLPRILGDAPVQKLPITPDILLRLHPQFTARSDSGFWAAMLIGFYTFFRKSNLVPKSEKDFDPAKNLCRHDIIVRPWGLVFAFVGQKQFNSESVSCSFPFCSSPTVTLSGPCMHMNVTFQNSQSPSLRLLSCIRKDHDIPITHSTFTDKLRKVLSHAGFPANKFSGHSFHCGGASYAFCCGSPVELISLQGDWSSDAVLLCIAQPLEQRLSVVKLIA